MKPRVMAAALLVAGLARADEPYGDGVHVEPPARPFLLVDARRRYLPREHARVFVQRRGHGPLALALFRVHDARAFIARTLSPQGVAIAQTRWGETAENLLRDPNPLPRNGIELSLVALRTVVPGPAPRPRRTGRDETAVYDSSELDEGAVETRGVRAREWSVADVDLGPLPAGTYLARVHDGVFAAAALVSVGDTVILARRGDVRDLVRVSDGEGAPLVDVEVEAFAAGEIVRARTNARGEAEIPASAQGTRGFRVTRGEDLAWTEVVHTPLPRCDTRVYLGTGRPVYRPGERVFVRGHVRSCAPLGGARVRVFPSAAGPEGETLTTDADGNFSATLLAASELGAEVEGRRHLRTLGLDTRPLPRSPISIVLDRPWAAAGERVEARVRPPLGTRLVRFESPAGQVVANVVDGAATAVFTLPPTAEALASFTVAATATLPGEFATARASLWTGRTREVLALDGDTTLGATGESRRFELEARDLGGNPSPGPITLSVSGSDGNRALGEARWRTEVAVPAEGRVGVGVNLVGRGPWWVQAARGEAVATRVVWERPRPAVLDGRGAFAVIPEASVVGPGEALRVAVRTAGPAWITLENGGVWASQWAAPGRDGLARVSFDPPEGSRGLATVVATRIAHGAVDQAQAVAEIATSTRFSLALDPDRRSYPAEARAQVIVRARTIGGRGRDAVVSLWLEDAGWWGLGEERHPSVDAYFRGTGRPASAGDSARPTGFGAEEGRRLASALHWNDELEPGTTFRHAWGHGGALVSFESRGNVAVLAQALARAAGMRGAWMCPARVPSLGTVRLAVRELPWDLAAERFAARTRTFATRTAEGLRFACDPPPQGLPNLVASNGGTGSGHGASSGSGGLRHREHLEGTRWFLATRRLGPNGEALVEVPLPAEPGRWRLQALAIADDGAGATAHTFLHTVSRQGDGPSGRVVVPQGDASDADVRRRSAAGVDQGR